MNKNGLYLILGTIAGATLAYMAYRHKDEILEKVRELEIQIKEKKGVWSEKAEEFADKAKEGFAVAIEKLQTVVEKYATLLAEGKENHDEKAKIQAELDEIKASIGAL